MPDEITPETFDHLVDLAALELSPAEAEYLRRQLNNQLKAIHELAAIPLSGAETPTSHGVPYPPALSQPPREDVWQPYADPAAILAQAPESDEGYIVVPEIPTTQID